jgi:hypothetical protein
MKEILVFVLLCVFFNSCDKPKPIDPEPGGSGGSGNCNGPAKSFAADVNPIIQGSCATAVSCHAVGSTTGPGPLVTYSQIFSVRSTIRSEVAGGHMPPNGTLPITQKNAIICWIDNGAPNN